MRLEASSPTQSDELVGAQNIVHEQGQGSSMSVPNETSCNMLHDAHELCWAPENARSATREVSPYRLLDYSKHNEGEYWFVLVLFFGIFLDIPDANL